MATYYYRVKDPNIVDEIKQNFIPDSGYDIETLAQDLKEGMTNNPDAFCVMLGKDDDGKIIGHIVGWLPRHRHFAWFDQAWSVAPCKHTVNGFKLFENWCRDNGRTEIRMETKRSPRAMNRAYGFTEYSVTMIKAIDNV